MHIPETGLADELQDYIRYTPASGAQRFLNWLVDNLLMRFGLTAITGTMVGYMLASLFPEYMLRISYDESRIDLIVIGYALAIVNYLIYYTFCEKVFRGYTLGKLLSGTRAMRTDGAELTWRNAFLRSLSRLVPFEPFSALTQDPWHDRWTDTMVVKAR